MKKKYIVLVFIFFTYSISAQNSFLDKINLYKIENDSLGLIEVGVFKSKNNKKKPLLLMLGGSGLEPTFSYHSEEGNLYSSGIVDFIKYKEDYHIVYINKAGIPLYSTIANNKTPYQVSKFAVTNNTLDWRAQSASIAIDYLVDKLEVDENNIFVVGHSQGGQVAPKVAVLNNKVTKVVMMSANALDHVYDRILIARQQAINNDISYEDSQYIVDSLFNEQKKIYSKPNSIEDKFWGDTYKKWHSYSVTTPLDNMLKLDVPILMISGGRDINGSYIANTDYAVLEFIRRRKENLEYKVYPNYNHGYAETKIKDDGTEYISGYKSAIVVNDVYEWLNR